MTEAEKIEYIISAVDNMEKILEVSQKSGCFFRSVVIMIDNVLTLQCLQAGGVFMNRKAMIDEQHEQLLNHLKQIQYGSPTPPKPTTEQPVSPSPSKHRMTRLEMLRLKNKHQH